MKNSVYASKGRKFTSPDLAAIFETQSWYKGTIEAKEFDNNLEKYLSKEEQAYINKIVKKQEECDKNKEIFELIRKSEAWLKNPRPEVKIYKWNTKEWGEIPADFGRK